MLELNGRGDERGFGKAAIILLTGFGCLFVLRCAIIGCLLVMTFDLHIVLRVFTICFAGYSNINSSCFITLTH